MTKWHIIEKVVAGEKAGEFFYVASCGEKCTAMTIAISGDKLVQNIDNFICTECWGKINFMKG